LDTIDRIINNPNLGWRVAYFIPGGLVVIACILGLLIKESKAADESKI